MDLGEFKAKIIVKNLNSAVQVTEVRRERSK